MSILGRVSVSSSTEISHTNLKIKVQVFDDGHIISIQNAYSVGPSFGKAAFLPEGDVPSEHLGINTYVVAFEWKSLLI